MEGSVQTEQTLLAELITLRARVAELEQSLAHLEHSQPTIPPVAAMQRPLQEGDARFRRLFQTNIMGTAIADFQGGLLEVNNAFLEMLGYTRADFEQQLLRWDRITPAEFRSVDEQAIAEIKLHGVCAPYEKQFIAKDGRRVPVLICDIQLEGATDQCIAYVLDLTENKELQQTIQQTTEKTEEQARELEVIFETLTDGIAVYDLQGNIIRTNKALRALLGLESADVYPALPLEQRVQQMQMRDERGNLLAPDAWPVRRILCGETLTNKNAVDIRLWTFGGHHVQFNISGAPLRDKSGETVGGVILFHDVTERRQNELALLEANRRMDEFLSIASHELRTPLTTINGNIQLAKRRLKILSGSQEIGEEQANKLEFVQELLSRAEKQVRVQNRLVGDLLDVSRIQANRLELNMSQCDLVEIAQEVVEDQRSAVPSRSIRLDIPYATAVPIEADRDRVGQVLTNYLSNALKYSATDRPVVVRVTAEGEKARVSVQDEGPGIPVEEQPHLWERFYRVPNITVLSGTGVGLGLGLHICKTIIDRHSGQVGVESLPNKGSTFWFTIPVVNPARFAE